MVALDLSVVVVFKRSVVVCGVVSSVDVVAGGDVDTTGCVLIGSMHLLSFVDCTLPSSQILKSCDIDFFDNKYASLLSERTVPLAKLTRQK